MQVPLNDNYIPKKERKLEKLSKNNIHDSDEQVPKVAWFLVYVLTKLGYTQNIYFLNKCKARKP